MKSSLGYLLAARQCEIDELERLVRTSELVNLVARYAHALQLERGTSNIYLASRGAQFADQRLAHIADSDRIGGEVLAAFAALETRATSLPNGARLFNRIAIAMHALEGLPELRSRVAVQSLTPRGSTGAYVRLIAGLLAVVFEAADSAGDPEISRSLVALFNFMQGKEFAGQERALGAAVFATGRIDAPLLREWRHLIEQQQQCFSAFEDFAEPQALAAEHSSQDPRVLAQIERLRRTGWSLEGSPDLTATVQAWFDFCSLRIDAMRVVEDLLARNLRAQCERKIAQDREALRDQQAGTEMLLRQAGTEEAGSPRRFGPQLEKSVYDMVQDQSRRLQAMGDELALVRSALNERKVVERAKGLLMAHRHLSEDDAYKTLRQMAMNQKKRIADVAEAVLAMAEMLPTPLSPRA